MTREGTVAFIRRSCVSYLHPVGVCAMGPIGEAVADAELCDRGVEGLRIGDASIMPMIPAGPTNAPGIILVGGHAADFDQWAYAG
jgi:choline dehydrogenase